MPNFTRLCDMHTHTNFSPDASDSPDAMCLRAENLGLSAYAVTDHCDCNFWQQAPSSDVTDRDMYGAQQYSAASIAEITRLKEKYRGRLNLVCGIELGQPMQNLQAAEQIAADKRLDFIIGSHHQNRGKDDFYWIKYDKLDSCEIDRLLDDCFAETLEMCKWGKFDVLGHLTYPLRYICGEYGLTPDMNRHEEVIGEIFRTLAQNGCGIEINTSGLRQKYGFTFPTLRYVKLFRSLGGEIITLGSDAHRADDIAKGLAEGAQLAAQAGFHYIAAYRERKPLFIKI